MKLTEEPAVLRRMLFEGRPDDERSSGRAGKRIQHRAREGTEGQPQEIEDARIGLSRGLKET